MEKFKKINDEMIAIKTIPDEHDEARDFEPSFWFYNRRYYLNDFVRVHNNPWIGGEWPEYIHGMEAENYYNPLFIELVDDEYINIYQEV